MKSTTGVQLLAVFLVVSCGVAQAQRVAPGVNPNHYQQDPNQQHYQQQYQQQPPQQQQYQQQQQQQYQQPPQQQQQYQQPPQQQQQYQQPPPQQQQHYQQPPQQQQQYQQPPQQQQQQQQAPQNGGHHHDHHNSVLGGNVQEEKAHIAEHMEVPLDTSKMTEQELQFHYFKMHDADNNNKLDGCELIKSLIHWHVTPDNDNAKAPAYTDEQIATMVDATFTAMDKDQDGMIDFAEYRTAEAHDD